MISSVSPWFLITLAIVAVESAVAEIIGTIILGAKQGSRILLVLIGILAGAVTGTMGVLMMGTEKGILFSAGIFAVTAIGGMTAGAVSGMIGRIFGTALRGFVADDFDEDDDIDESPPSSGPVRIAPQTYRTRPAPPVEPVIRQSCRKKSGQHRVAYISLFLALAEELIKAILQDKPVFWVILSAALLLLSFISQRVLTYRSERDLYGTSYPEARETASYILERRRKTVTSRTFIFTQKEIDRCLQINSVKRAPDEKLDKADKTSSLLKRFLDMILMNNPTKTGLGVLLGVVIHTVLENFPAAMSETTYYEIFAGLPVYFWIAFSILLLNFRNLFVDSLKKSSLGVLLGIVGYTVYENVKSFTEMELSLPVYFWIAAGVLALNLLNLLFTPRIDRELKIQMRYIKEAQKNGDFTEGERRQQWRNFIALVNEKASESA